MEEELESVFQDPEVDQIDVHRVRLVTPEPERPARPVESVCTSAHMADPSLAPGERMANIPVRLSRTRDHSRPPVGLARARSKSAQQRQHAGSAHRKWNPPSAWPDQLVLGEASEDWVNYPQPDVPPWPVPCLPLVDNPARSLHHEGLVCSRLAP